MSSSVSSLTLRTLFRRLSAASLPSFSKRVGPASSQIHAVNRLFDSGSDDRTSTMQEEGRHAGGRSSMDSSRMKAAAAYDQGRSSDQRRGAGGPDRGREQLFTRGTPGDRPPREQRNSDDAPRWRDDWTEDNRDNRGRGGGRRDGDNGSYPRRDGGEGASGRGAGRGMGRDGPGRSGDRSGPRRSASPDPSSPYGEDFDLEAGAHSESAADAYAGRADAPPAVKAKPTPLPVLRERDSDKGTFFHSSSFKKAGASDEVVAALKTLGISRPSHVQAESYRLLLDRELLHVAIMDQAGSGKTLAYLLPLLQQLSQEEQELKAAAVAEGASPEARFNVAAPKAPRLIVLAPTTELAQQVYRVAKALSASGLKFRSACMTGGQEERERRGKSWRTQVQQLEGGLDLVVATPGRLVEHLQAGSLELFACKAIVLDEVDVLLGDQAAFDTQIDPLREAAPPNLRFVLVTATLPQHTLALVKQGFPDLSLAMGPGLHRTAAGLEEELVDCSGGDDISLEAGTQRKLEALGKVLSRRGASRVLIFCNKIETCRTVENFLGRSDRQGSRYKVMAYHEAIRDEVRAENLNAFLQPIERGEGIPPVVLVATDRMSRGIDSMYCEHVVLFDFPRDPSEYVRRVGRTARGAGGRGTVSVLVLGRQVPLARDIMDGNQKGRPVHKLPDVE